MVALAGSAGGRLSRALRLSPAGPAARLQSISVLSAGWLALAVVVAILLTFWVTFTLTRLDRLHARVDAAQASLDAQLVRRAVALLALAESRDVALDAERRSRDMAVAHAALAVAGAPADNPSAPPSLSPSPATGAGGAAPASTIASRHGTLSDRQGSENAVGRVIRDGLVDPEIAGITAGDELREASERVLLARRFYNDAVRDTRTLRARRMPRLLHLAGRRAVPEYFDIDDTVPPSPR